MTKPPILQFPICDRTIEIRIVHSTVPFFSRLNSPCVLRLVTCKSNGVGGRNSRRDVEKAMQNQSCSYVSCIAVQIVATTSTKIVVSCATNAALPLQNLTPKTKFLLHESDMIL